MRLTKNWENWLWPTAEGVMGVPLWTKVSDEVMMEMDTTGGLHCLITVHPVVAMPTIHALKCLIHCIVALDNIETAAAAPVSEPQLRADSKPFVFNASAKPFVPKP